jgi:hypothetical protein
VVFDYAVHAALAFQETPSQFRIQFGEGVVSWSEHCQLAGLAEHGHILFSEHFVFK